MIQERLAALRSLMKEHQIDAYLVPTDDFHASEYVGSHFKCREFITGFTGSAGTAVICQDQAGLWTDGRYFIQAASQLADSGITLYRIGEEGVPTIAEFLQKTLKPGQCLGFDGRTVTAKEGCKLEELLKKQNVSLSCQLDLINEIWTDRPSLSCEPAWSLALKYAGKPRNEKVRELRGCMAEKNADYFLLTSLDDIAWLLNLRGNDTACNPVVLAYLAVTQSQVLLFAQENAFSDALQAELKKDGVMLQPYNDIYAYAAKIPADRSIWADYASINYALANACKSASASQPQDADCSETACRTGSDTRITMITETNPTLLPKAIKNPVETANMKKAHLKDGVAVTRFIYWLKQNIGKMEITEISAAEKLESFRAEDKNYMGPSFEPILSYGSHAAIVHYSATPETDIPLESHGLLLADTGGQYLEGTTDITRTIVLGETSEKEKDFFTRVLRGNLNLANARFLYGCNGKNLDYLAREPLWEVGEDFNHGTGHGVGYLLNVHEGPQGFRWRTAPHRSEMAVFEEGMITSNEPGFYLEGEFGIRHENLILCKKAEKKPCGQFMEFETLTLVPFDLDAVLADQMSVKERKLLNEYHRTVYEKISPYLPEEEKVWLKEATREI